MESLRPSPYFMTIQEKLKKQQELTQRWARGLPWGYHWGKRTYQTRSVRLDDKSETQILLNKYYD